MLETYEKIDRQMFSKICHPIHYKIKYGDSLKIEFINVDSILLFEWMCQCAYLCATCYLCVAFTEVFTL